jgi:hypothetical protein
MSSANSEAGIRQGDLDLAECDAKRQLLIDSWPKGGPDVHEHP